MATFRKGKFLSGVYFASGVCITLAISACNTGNSPSDALIKESIVEFVSQAPRKGITIIDVKRTDGLTRSDGSYVADFTAQVKFNECGWRFGGEFYEPLESLHKLNTAGEGCRAKPGEIATEKKRPSLVYYGIGVVLNVPGQATFLKKDSGWKMSSSTISDSDEFEIIEGVPVVFTL